MPNEKVEIYDVKTGKTELVDKIQKTDKDWEKELGSQSFCVLRQHQTERPHTGPLNQMKEKGIYKCAACGTDLFRSNDKFDSGTGWPSFFQPVAETNIGTREDADHGMRRTEIHCARCGGHLGHVFEDGPEPTGMRYCINSASLKFEKQE